MNAKSTRAPPTHCEGNAAPYVLGALTDDERAAFRRHLQSCAVCREEVASLRTVVARCRRRRPPRARRPELKSRIMTTVRARPASPSWAGARSGGPRGADAGPWPAIALAGAAVLAVRRAGRVGSGGSGGATRVIRAQVRAPGASALVALSGDRAELRLAGMPQTAPGRVYEVWVKRAGRTAADGCAVHGHRRPGGRTVGVPGRVAGVSEVLVSSEPLGGSRVPTRTPGDRRDASAEAPASAPGRRRAMRTCSSPAADDVADVELAPAPALRLAVDERGLCASSSLTSLPLSDDAGELEQLAEADALAGDLDLAHRGEASALGGSRSRPAGLPASLACGDRPGRLRVAQRAQLARRAAATARGSTSRADAASSGT